MELNYKEFKIKQIFINTLLKKGKKIKSENIFKNILINLKKQPKQKPYFILLKSIKNLLPKLKLISIPNKKKNIKKKKDSYFLMRTILILGRGIVRLDSLIIFSKAGKNKNYISDISNMVGKVRFFNEGSLKSGKRHDTEYVDFKHPSISNQTIYTS
jgi:hypothetical protein